MASQIRLSPRLLTDVFWDVMFIADEEREAEKKALFARLNGQESLRALADYNTGSFSLTAGWCLYNLVRYFKARRIIEVGTFIGKSTIAMAQAMDDEQAPGDLFTCDFSNAIPLPWEGKTRLHQFQKASSTDMLKAIDAPCDFVFLDGRLQGEDLALLDPLIAKDTIVALDDFEGMEKGVINLTSLSRLEKLRSHITIYPPSRAWLQARGYSGYSLMAVMVPVSSFVFARQG